MVLVEEAGVAGQVPLEQGAGLLVAGGRREQAMAVEDASRVGVHDEDRPPQGVEKDAVGSLGTDAGDGEQPGAKLRQGRSVHPAEASPVAPPEVGEKSAKPPRFDPERA